MNLTNVFSLAILTLTLSCNGQNQPQEQKEMETPKKVIPQYSLTDYYSNNRELEDLVDSVYASLNDTQQLAQMVVSSAGELGKPKSAVRKVANQQLAGGVLFLKGEKNDHTQFIDELNTIAEQKGGIKMLFSIDAEPSLYNRRVIGSGITVPTTLSIKDSAQAAAVAQSINSELKEMGFHQNYAPVVDLSPNNEAIKNRSFGSHPDSVIHKSLGFIEGTQNDGIVATAKHFPGHGYVTGDTHKQSVYIDGEMKEVNVYKPLIEAGVISIMVAHVAVENNEKYGTNGLPSTLSPVIVTDLLRNEMGFNGIIVTDAMNMMAAAKTGESAPLRAALAGCDMILMPTSEKQLISEMLTAQAKNPEVKQQFEASVKRILRLKMCLNLID